MPKAVLLLFAFLLVDQSGYAKASAQLTEGQFSLQGNLQIPFEINRKVRLVTLDVSPEIGYFLWDNFQIHGGPRIKANLYHSDEKSRPLIWGAELGVRYFADFGWSIRPFAGLSFGMLVNNASLVTLRWDFEAPVGVFWPVNEHVGLQFGIRARYTGSTSNVFENFEVIPGYMGIMAFF